jgi:hypothetical protein
MEKRTNYRWIWECANGPIPKDENGVSYQIHHIDGNRNNNELSNLMCVSIDEHIEIHKKQGEWESVAFLEQMRGRKATGWKHSDETKKKISEKQKEQFQSGERVHPMLGKKRPDLAERNKEGHSEEMKKKLSEIKKKNPTKYWLGKSRKGIKVNHPTLTCPHCGKVGKGESAMKKWHFDNCRNNLDK